MKILVTGATGTIGSQVARALLDRGAEVVPLDFDEPATLAGAFDGIDRLFLLTPFVETFLPQVEAAVSAAKAAGAKVVVRLSALGADPNADDGLAGQHGKAEEIVKGSGLDWVVVRPTFFADNVLTYQGAQVAQGSFYGASHGGKVAYVSSRDIGEAVAAILAEPSRHVGQTYTLTGPTAVSDDEVAQLLTAIADRKIAYVDLSGEQLLQGQIDAGAPRWMAEHLVALEGVKAAGWAASTSDDIRRILGRDPEAPRALLERHAGSLRA